ncbi:putative CRM domain-containing protein [Dendrobium catenatum]|uniref:Putative CRM domain-containing protein n=1 Tax=Dendrobium catenatum TaxID=906689 RepID=A0A2I0W2F0_9ASPA|nr:putative CRM domain-containing protein [Dendrobium catenatum]
MGYCNLHTTHQLGTTGQNVVENDSMISAVPDAANDARKKEGHLVEALQKIEPKDSSVTMHDPEVLTPEEHFYLVKLGQKCKNYVPVGRRGIFQGVILNMHLHWKKHQTLKVIVKTFTPEEVREIAAELARLSGGIVLEISEDNTIIMYRGKNYSQPPTEIMSPKITLTRKKATFMRVRVTFGIEVANVEEDVPSRAVVGEEVRVSVDSTDLCTGPSSKRMSVDVRDLVIIEMIGCLTLLWG